MIERSTEFYDDEVGVLQHRSKAILVAVSQIMDEDGTTLVSTNLDQCRQTLFAELRTRRPRTGESW